MSTQFTPATQTIERPKTTEYRYDEGDQDRFSHYVAKDKLTEAMVMGNAVIALCGKKWIPSRDPERFPVCPTCKEIWQQMKPGGDGDGSDGQD
jgi:hypothetical protein